MCKYPNSTELYDPNFNYTIVTPEMNGYEQETCINIYSQGNFQFHTSAVVSSRK
jgi:hypothetical protein